MVASNVINFFEAKKRFIDGVVYVGDTIEYTDWNGHNFVGKVIDIEHLPLDGHFTGERLDCFPIWEKEKYSVFLEGGLSISGSIIVRKIIKHATPKGKTKFVSPNRRKSK